MALCKNCELSEGVYLGFPTKYPYCSLSCYDGFMSDYKRVDLWEARILWIANKLRKMKTPANYIDWYDKIRVIEAPTNFFTRHLRVKAFLEPVRHLRFSSYWDLCNPVVYLRRLGIYHNAPEAKERYEKVVKLNDELRNEYAYYASHYLYGRIDHEVIDKIKRIMTICISKEFYRYLTRSMRVPIDPDLLNMVYVETKGHLDYMLGFTEGRTIGGGYPLSDFTQFPSPKLII